MATTVTETPRHTLTVTDSDFQLTVISGPQGPAGADSTVAGPAGLNGAAGPNSITSSTDSDNTGNIGLSSLTTSTLAAGSATISNSLTMTGNQFFGDGLKANFGTGNDLEIFHDGTQARIINTTGELQIWSQVVDGDITLYADSGTGGSPEEYIRLDGSLVGTQFSKRAMFHDNVKIQLGTSQDLEIYHDGSNSYIKEAGTGGLFIQGDTTITIEKTDGENMAEFIPDGAVNLYYNNVVKLATSATGITTQSIYLSGDLDLQDTSGANSGKIKIGSGDDLQLYHDGTQSIINNLTGNLFISTLSADTDIIFYADNGSGSVVDYFRLDGGLASSGARYTTWPDNSRVTFGADQDLQLYHDGTNSFIANSTGTLNIQGNTAFSAFLNLPDSDSNGGVLRFGADNDLQIYHNGSDSYIDDAGTGNLNLRGANLNLQKYTGETFIACVADGSVSVYHDNAAKLATTATGVSVTGNVISTGLLQHKVYTVAAGADQIPVATGLAGTRAFVSDSNHTLNNHHGATLAGGGAHFVPVFSDGTNWIVG